LQFWIMKYSRLLALRWPHMVSLFLSSFQLCPNGETSIALADLKPTITRDLFCKKTRNFPLFRVLIALARFIIYLVSGHAAQCFGNDALYSQFLDGLDTLERRSEKSLLFNFDINGI
jgi:hypothetical protein